MLQGVFRNIVIYFYIFLSSSFLFLLPAAYFQNKQKGLAPLFFSQQQPGPAGPGPRQPSPCANRYGGQGHPLPSVLGFSPPPPLPRRWPRWCRRRGRGGEAPPF